MSRACEQCGHSMLAHANLQHNSPVIPGRHSEKSKERSNLRIARNNKNVGKISCCYLCRTQDKTCTIRTTIGEFMEVYKNDRM